MTHRHPRLRAATALAGIAVVAAALTGCDAFDAARGDTDGDGDTGSGLAGAGEPEDWARAVCGADAVLGDDDGAVTCQVDSADGTEHEVEAYVEGEEPDLAGRADSLYSGDGVVAAWAVAELDSEYGVVWLVGGPSGVDESLLEPLRDEGFEIDE